MNINRKHWWAAGLLAVVLLVFWMGRSDLKPETETETEPRADEPSSKVVEQEGSSRRHAHRRHTQEEECSACPETSLTEGMKRTTSPEDSTDRACQELLRESAAIGNPEPSLSHLGGCKGKTPLHYASTAEQVQLLLDNGADPNIRDQYGVTPISRQGASAVVNASEEKIAVIQTLLEAGADPWIKDEFGRSPLQMAQKMNLGGFTSELSLKRMEQRLRSRGLSQAEAEKDPRYIAARERMESQIRLSARAISELMKGMIKTAPPSMSVPELPEGL